MLSSSAISSIFLTAISQARSNPSAIFNGWMPLSSNFWACSKMAPAKTTTPVVPSPISLSYDADNSANSLAVWWWIFNFIKRINIAYLHLFKNCGTIICYNNFTVGTITNENQYNSLTWQASCPCLLDLKMSSIDLQLCELPLYWSLKHLE